MAIASKDRFVAKLRAIRQDIPYTDYQNGNIGRLNTDGTKDPDIRSGLAIGEVWVRLGEVTNGSADTRAAVPVLTKRNDPHGTPVVTAINRKTRVREVIGLATQEAIDLFGKQTPAINAGVSGAIGTSISTAENILPLAAYPSTHDSDPPFTVYINSGWHPGGYWQNDKLIVVPTATSGKKSLVCVGITKDNTATYELTADVDPSYMLTQTDANAIILAFPDTEWTTAFVIWESDTDINLDRPGSYFSLSQIKTGHGKNNLSATTDPGVGDDIADGYSIGSWWLNTSTPSLFWCADATTGAAIWEQSTVGGNKDKFTQVGTQTVANTATETTLLGSGQGAKSFDINAVGRTVEGEVWGVISSLAILPGTLDVKVTVNGTDVISTGAVTLTAALSGALWNLRYRITVNTTGATGTVLAQGKFVITNTLADIVEMMSNGTSTVTVDLTGTPAQNVTATFGTADVANSISSTNADLRLLDPNI